MQRWGLIVVMLAACGGDDGGASSDGGPEDGGGTTTDGAPADVPGGIGEPPEMMGMTLAHNQVRAMVQTPTPLPPLEWDPSLAATAAAWVAMCQGSTLLSHNPNRSDGHPYYIGENIYASSGTATAQGAVTSWASEKSDYNYANNSCSGVCGHYTQIVWRTTLKVGCARGSCPNLTYPSTIVCNYGPGGNLNGQSPY